MPNEQVPALELEDGTKIGQSNSLVRYLGKKYGYYPTDVDDAYKVDALVDLYLDYLPKFYQPYFK